jgi:hypothetical protein
MLSVGILTRPLQARGRKSDCLKGVSVVDDTIVMVESQLQPTYNPLLRPVVGCGRCEMGTGQGGNGVFGRAGSSSH